MLFYLYNDFLRIVYKSTMIGLIHFHYRKNIFHFLNMIHIFHSLIFVHSDMYYIHL